MNIFIFGVCTILFACGKKTIDPPLAPEPIIEPEPEPEPVLESVILEEEKSGPQKVEGPYQKGVRPAAEKEEKKLNLTIESIIREDFPKRVVAYVYIRDEEGNFISGMAEKGVYDQYPNDVWQIIQEQQEAGPCPPGDVKIEEIREEDAPSRAVSFVADYSGSMSGTIGLVERDIPIAIDELRFEGKKTDTWGLTKFDHVVQKTLPIPQNTSIDQDTYLQGLYGFGGGTALRDAINLGVAELKDTALDKERIAIVFTDGYENSSISSSWNEVLYLALKNKVRVHIVGYGQVDKKELLTIADRTGGSFYHLQQSSSIDGVMRGIIHKTKVYYRISYSPCKNDEERTLVIRSKVSNSIEEPNMATYTYSHKKIDFGVDNRPRLLVLFPFGSSNIRKITSGKEKLIMIANYLNSNPDVQIKLYGHTDTKGSNNENQSLGLKRAKAVAKELQRLGVSMKRINFSSSGEKKLMHDPDYPVDWRAAENRRVEFNFFYP